MCKLVTLKLDSGTIRVADIKKDAIENVAQNAALCKNISKIILFGSSTKESCTKESDIDLAIFGDQAKNKCLTSASFRKFTSSLYRFDDFNETYDLLYFQNGKRFPFHPTLLYCPNLHRLRRVRRAKAYLHLQSLCRKTLER